MEDLYQLYKELKKLALKEKKLIEEADYQSLKAALSQKDKLIKKIDEIDHELYFEKLEEKNSDQVDLKEKRKAIYQLLKKTNELEQEKLKLLKQQKEDVKSKILKLYTREKSIKGYRKEEKFEAKFFDEKS